MLMGAVAAAHHPRRDASPSGSATYLMERHASMKSNPLTASECSGRKSATMTTSECGGHPSAKMTATSCLPPLSPSVRVFRFALSIAQPLFQYCGRLPKALWRYGQALGPLEFGFGYPGYGRE